MEHMAYNTKYYPSLIRKRQYWLMLQTISCQKPNIKDRETIKWKKGQITTQKPKDRATRTHNKQGWSQVLRVGRSWSTCGTCRVTLVTNPETSHKRGKDSFPVSITRSPSKNNPIRLYNQYTERDMFRVKYECSVLICQFSSTVT